MLERYRHAITVILAASLLGLFTASCYSRPRTEPFPGPGRLLLLGTSDDGIGIYELKEGDTVPELLWPDVPDLPPPLHPVVSPDGSHLLLSGSFVLNLQTGRGYDIVLDDEDSGGEAAFSPDATHLAAVTKRGLVLVDVETSEQRIILRKECATYTCGKLCLAIDFPFWIDKETILVLTHRGVRKSLLRLSPICGQLRL